MNKKYVIIAIIIAVLLLVLVFVLGCTAKKTEPVVTTQVEETVKEESQTVATQTEIKEVPKVTGEVILIADTENQRVIEIDKQTKEILWQYGCNEVFSSGRCDYGVGNNQLYQPVSAVYDKDTILVADKSNDRVIKIGRDKNIVWSFTDLDDPTFAYVMSNGNILIADSVNNRVIEVNQQKEIVWKYGCVRMTNTDKCVAGRGEGELNVPNAAIELDNGNILIIDKGNNRVIEIDKATDQILYDYRSGLVFPQYSEPYGTGYVIANTNSNNVIAVDKDKQIAKEFKLNHPTYVEVNNGNFLITDSFNSRIIEMDVNGNIVWYYGDCSLFEGEPTEICQLGVEDGQLFKPSTAVLK